MRKGIFIAFVFLLVGIFFSSFVASEDCEILNDDMGRMFKVDCLNDLEDVMFSYYGDSDSVNFVYTGLGLNYEYDLYGNLIGEFDTNDASKDRLYFYDYSFQDMPLRRVYRNDAEVRFEYYSNGNLKSESVISDNRKFVTYYGYDARNNLILITDLKSKSTFEYDERDRLIREEISTIESVDEYMTLQSVSYVYDEYDNVIALIDGTGIIINYTYVQKPYDCDGSTCYYSELVSKKINNFEVNITDDLDRESYVLSTGGNYTPDRRYDSRGYLVQEGSVYYNYANDYSQLEQIRIAGADGTSDAVVNLSYDLDGLLAQKNYNSDFVSVSEVVGYDSLDRVVYSDMSSQAGSGVTGAVIKNIFTGFALFGGDLNSQRTYYTRAGDVSSSITSDEYVSLVGSENIWPELKDAYLGAVDNRGNLNERWLDAYCYDSDGGEDEIYRYGFSELKDNVAYDSCIDNQTLMEYSCDYRLFKWDFWNLESRPESFIQTCEYGCDMGRCLTVEEVEEPIVIELPPEPSELSGGV